MNALKIVCLLIFFIFVLDLVNIYGQDNKDANRTQTQKDYYIKREKQYEENWLRQTRYYDQDADSLYISQSAHCSFFDYRYVFFRRTPLSLKTGWTNVFSSEEVDLIEVYGLGGRGTFGKKGYNITWILINDSIFIKDITLRDNPDSNHENKKLLRDTIIARLENFTNCTFHDSLLFVDWISGDFGVITKHLPNANLTAKNSIYRKAIEEGFVITFDHGKIVKIEEDKRENKY